MCIFFIAFHSGAEGSSCCCWCVRLLLDSVVIWIISSNKIWIFQYVFFIYLFILAINIQTEQFDRNTKAPCFATSLWYSRLFPQIVWRMLVSISDHKFMKKLLVVNKMILCATSRYPSLKTRVTSIYPTIKFNMMIVIWAKSVPQIIQQKP